MTDEIITLVVAGKQYTGWESITITAALNEVARSFDIKVSEITSGQLDKWHFPPGTAVDVKSNGTLMLSGHVDDYEPSLDALQHSVAIRGRSKSADLADSHSGHPTGQFENKTLTQIAQELTKDFADIKRDVRLGKDVAIDLFRAGKVHSIYETILRIARQRKTVLKGQADGSVLMTKAGGGRHAGTLAEGINIKKISAKLSMRERFSEYQVVGQSSDHWDDDQLRPKGSATDPHVKRKRVKVIVDQAQTNSGLARDRAEWERDRAAGRSLTATVTVASFRDDKGALWEPGWLVFVKSATVRLEQDMMIEKVEFKQDDKGGTEAILSLVDPRAYGGKKPAASESNGMWNMG